MSKALSLKLKENIFDDIEELISQIKIPRNKYINEAIDFYNKVNKRRLLSKQLEKESKLVRENSMEVLKEFELLEDDLC